MGPISLEVQQLTVLEYQMCSPHCPDRTANAHTGTNECGHLRDFDITVTERKKSLTKEPYSKFKDIVEGPHSRTFPDSFHVHAVFQQLNTFGVAFNYVATTSILVLCHCPHSSSKRLAGAPLNKHLRSVLSS